MIGWRIGELLEAQGMTNEQFAQRAGISYNTALTLRRGASRRVDLDTLDKVCQALGVEPEQLFDYAPSSVALGKSR